MKYRLQKIKVSNFKVFKEDFEISFENSDFSILGGPNGFGKTSIFDAIELALTGNIARFNSIEGSGCCDIIVQNNSEKPTLIHFSLANGYENWSFVRKLKEETFSKTQKKSSNFAQLWDFFQLDEKGKENPIEQANFEKQFGFSELNRYFSIFYYVQQEETTHFLKNTDKERLKALSELFDTKTENKNLEKINSFNGKLASYKDILNNQILKLEEKISSVSTTKVSEPKPYKKIFQGMDGFPSWDLEKLTFIGESAKERMLNEITKIESFIKFRDEFEIEKEFENSHQKLKTWIDKLLFLKAIPRLSNFETLLERKNKLNEILGKLSKEKVLELLSEKDLLLVSEEFSDFDAKAILESLNKLKATQTGLGERNKVYNEFLTEREDLSKKFRENVDLFPNDTECPLCGSNFKNFDALLESFKKKNTRLQAILSNDQETYKKAFDIFWEARISSLRDRIKQKLEQPEFNISEKFVSYLRNASERTVLINEILTWLTSLKIELDDCFILSPQEGKTLEDLITESKDRLLKRVEEKKPALSEEYLEAERNSNFEFISENFFKKSFNQVSLQELSEKKLYIEFQYFHSLSGEKEELTKLKEKKTSIERLLAKTKEIHEICRNKIRNHWKEIAKDIEIPFFLYTNKILQRFNNNGLGGIFLKDPLNQEELKSIRFVSNYDSDHDVINTMSSGQLSGIVIALTLAMNKLFGKGLNTILIDDPVQTMDDINMMSFIDLMRNEFKDKQVILSSHEDEVEKFFLYRYLKVGKKVQRVNVMDRISYQ